jgi:Mrp family chromosome partitioning ATPase
MQTDPAGSSLRPGYNFSYTDSQHGHEAAVNPLKMLHLFLRGRYLILFALISVLTPLGAWLGYRTGKVDYQSVGEIRFNPIIPAILHQDDENSVPPMFAEFLDAEAARIHSMRVLNNAVVDPEWKNWKSPLPDGFVNTLNEELSVSHSGLMVRVAVADPDKNAAMIAVRTIITAYRQIYDEYMNTQEETRDTALLDRQHQKESDVKRIRDEISDLANATEFGTDNLDNAYEDVQKQLQRTEAELQIAQLQLDHTGPTPTNSLDNSEEGKIQAIAHDNPKMAAAVNRRDNTQEDLAECEVEGLGPNNQRVVMDHKHLNLAMTEIKRYEDEYDQSHALTNATSLLTGGPTTRPIQDVVKLLNDERTSKIAELKAIGLQRLTLQSKREDEKEAEGQLEEVNQRIDELHTERSGAISGRMEVESDGDMPVIPHSDTHIAMAAVGGFGGMSLGVLFVTLLALRDRRFHGPEDTQFSAVRCPMLGMLPTLGNDIADTEQAAMAAHFVHGIRAMLQIKGNPPAGGGRVLAITSPSAHNGKTSLSLALGVSFAGAHSKTLLIDCDFIGRALSERTNAVARPRLGRLLRHSGLIDEEKLQEGLDHAVKHGRRLGEALVDMGHLSAEKLDATLVAQQSHAFGIVEAIDGEDLSECVAPTAIPGLSILPLGQASPEHIGSLSPAMLQQVLDATRQQYDIVIVDTGPILGSLEASMVATQADDVVLVLSNGENRSAAERSLRYLEMVGAKVAGFVFNRATPRDFAKSQSVSHVSSTSADRWRHAKKWEKSDHLAGFGPVAQAVARSVGEVENRMQGPPGPAAKGNESNGASPNGNGKNGNGHNGNGHSA